MSEPKDQTEAAGGGSALTAELGADYAPQSKRFLGFMVITGLPSTRPDEIEFWQDGKIIGRIVGLAPNVQYTP